MMSLLVQTLLASLLAQTPATKPITGEVVDGQGKPIANARVAFYAPPVGYFKGDAVEVNTTTNGNGEFSLVVPPLPRAIVNGIHLLAHAPGRAIGAKPYRRTSERSVLVLQDCAREP